MWPQVYLMSFLRPNPQCSCIHKTQRREKQRSSLLPRWDIAKESNNKPSKSQKSQENFILKTQWLKKKKKKKFSPIVWMNSQTGSDYPIEIWQSVKSQFFPDRLDEFPNRVWLPNCDLTSLKSQFFPNRLDEFPNRVWLPNWDLTRCQIPIFSRPFGWISKPGLITQLRFDKSQIPIFPRPFTWISKPGSNTQLRFDKCHIPNHTPTCLDSGFQAVGLLDLRLG